MRVVWDNSGEIFFLMSGAHIYRRKTAGSLIGCNYKWEKLPLVLITCLRPYQGC